MDFTLLMKVDYTVYWIIAIMYVAVLVTYVIRPNGLFKLDWITFGLHTALIIFRWIEAGHPPYHIRYRGGRYVLWIDAGSPPYTVVAGVGYALVLVAYTAGFRFVRDVLRRFRPESRGPGETG